MKKRKIFCLFPIVSILLTGCTFQEGWESVKTWFNDNIVSLFTKNGSSDKKSGSNTPGDVTPEDPKTHATSISATPNAPFYLKVGETTNLSVTLSPSTGVAESEKLFRWDLQGDNIDCDLSTTDKKISITGAKAGKCILTATNTYNVSLSKKFTINVIDFDESKDYLWQYSSSDRTQFGYNSSTAKQGTPSGVARLNGLEWSYSRKHENPETHELEDYVSSLQSSMGAVGFGKGGYPETHLHFETENDREVSKITIEAGSSHSLAKVTVKVGETVYMSDQVAPYTSGDVVPTLPAATGSATGKIEIDVVTPEVDPTQSQSPTYYTPGAFYLKSILINFNDTIPDETLTWVKSATDFTAGDRYLIVGKFTDNSFYCLDGSLSSGAPDNPHLLSEFEFEDVEEITISASEVNRGFILSFDENEKLLFTADNGLQVGMNNSSGGQLSVTKSPANLGWSYSLLSGGRIDIFMVNSSSANRHLGLKEKNDGSPKFNCYSDTYNPQNIYLFKFN